MTMPVNTYSDINSNIANGNCGMMQELALELSNMAMLSQDDNELKQQMRNLSQGYSSDDSTGAPNTRSRSSNMTECVPVPSSEHVAEIVGRQGCKIKALRAKTNTYIKTPVRGEEPVFVVTGRKEDVASAKREILSAAEHFSQIRASRRNSGVSLTNGNLSGGPPSPGTPGQVTIQVRVPYRVVGLVVGPKGATIKRIQQQTHTYIVTPSRDKEPVFEVTGLPENVETARLEIESHIAMRTGGTVDSNSQFQANGVDSGYGETFDIFSTMYNNNSRPQSKSVFSAYNNDNMLNQKNIELTNCAFNFPAINSNTLKISDFSALNNGFNNFTSLSDKNLENDEGIGSPSFDPLQPPVSMWPHDSLSAFFTNDLLNNDLQSHQEGLSMTTPRLSPTITDANDFYYNGTDLPDTHTSVSRIKSDPLSVFSGGESAFSPFSNMNIFSVPSYTGAFSSTGSSPHTPASSSSPVNESCSPTDDASRRRNCVMCSDSEIVAALVPCGHNYFCMECANLVVERAPLDRQCPLCKETVTQAIRIFS